MIRRNKRGEGDTSTEPADWHARGRPNQQKFMGLGGKASRETTPGNSRKRLRRAWTLPRGTRQFGRAKEPQELATATPGTGATTAGITHVAGAQVQQMGILGGKVRNEEVREATSDRARYATSALAHHWQSSVSSKVNQPRN